MLLAMSETQGAATFLAIAILAFGLLLLVNMKFFPRNVYGCPHLRKLVRKMNPKRWNMSYDLPDKVKPKAIIVHSSTPELQEIIAKLKANKLDLPNGQCISLVINQGPLSLAHPAQLYYDQRFLRGQISKLLKLYPSVERIILILNEGYDYDEPQNSYNSTQADLRQIADCLSRINGKLIIELFHGKIYGKRFSFKEVDR